MTLDDLDKKILHEICSGIYSYDDLGKKLNVTRSTIYRRIEKLEKEKLITRRIMAVPNFDKLNLSAILVAIAAAYDDVSQCIQQFKDLPNTNLLYRCYGAHQAYAHLLCQKGDEAKVIEKIQIALKDQKTISYTISVGFRLEKIDFAPF